MELRQSDQKTFVRIIIGTAELGKPGIKKPSKSISLNKTNVKEMYNKIMEMIKNEK